MGEVKRGDGNRMQRFKAALGRRGSLTRWGKKGGGLSALRPVGLLVWMGPRERWEMTVEFTCISATEGAPGLSIRTRASSSTVDGDGPAQSEHSTGGQKRRAREYKGYRGVGFVCCRFASHAGGRTLDSFSIVPLRRPAIVGPFAWASWPMTGVCGRIVGPSAIRSLRDTTQKLGWLKHRGDVVLSRQLGNRQMKAPERRTVAPGRGSCCNGDGRR